MPVESLPDDNSTPAPSLFESNAWRRVLERTYGLSFHQAHRDGIEATLPFATTTSALRARAVSLPFSDYVVTEETEPSVYHTLVEEVRAAYPSVPLVVKTTYPHDIDSLGSTDQKGFYHRVPTPSHDRVDDNMRSSFQRGVRKAKREDVTTDWATGPEALSAFYDLHRSLRFGKFGKIPQPRRLFREIRRAFFEEDRGFVMQARRHGTVIGALVALYHRDTLYYKFGASAKEALDHRPNNLLFHDLLHHGVDAEVKAVDLGYSGAGPSYQGLRRFKESFGGRRQPITTFRFDPPDHDPEAEAELDEFLGDLTDTIVDQGLDEEATDAFSELIYPYFA